MEKGKLTMFLKVPCKCKKNPAITAYELKAHSVEATKVKDGKNCVFISFAHPITKEKTEHYVNSETWLIAKSLI